MTLESSGVRPLAVPSMTLTARLRARWGSAAAVMLTPFVVGWVVPMIFEPDCRGTMPRLVFLLLEGPLLTVALSAYLDRGLRRGSSAWTLLPVALTIAATLGALCAGFAWVMTSVLGLGVGAFQGGEPLTTTRVVAFGTVVGMLQLVLWALSFAFPSAVEDARLRALQAEKLRLESERLRLESETLRANAELASLRSQLEPHFLLNTLNAIAGLVTQHPREARRLLGCVGDLLREPLRDVDELQPLEAELAWLRKYAEILESRHAEAIAFRWEIDDDATQALLPRFLLQPLVENAVNHGALQRETGGEVIIRARVDRRSGAATLVCEIEDNGPGLPREEPRIGAIGLRSVRRRIAVRFPDGDFSIGSTEGRTRCVLRVPFETTDTRAQPLAPTAVAS